MDKPITLPVLPDLLLPESKKAIKKINVILIPYLHILLKMVSDGFF